MPNLSKTIEEQKERAREIVNEAPYVDTRNDVYYVLTDDRLLKLIETTSHAILKAVVEVLEEKKKNVFTRDMPPTDVKMGINETLSDIQTIINNVIEGK